jgi:hypothetical protein
VDQPLRGDGRRARWLSAEVRAELAAQYVQDLDVCEYRRRTCASVARAMAARVDDEDPDKFVVRPRADCRACARLEHGDSEDFEHWLPDIADPLD